MSTIYEKPSMEKLSLKDKIKARHLCLEALYIYLYGNHTPSILASLDWITGSNKPKEKVCEYYQYLLLGSIGINAESKELIKEFANKRDQEYIFKIDMAILQLSIFSLLYEKDIPAIVIINESINLAKLYSGIEGHKFINGVLDGVYKSYLKKD